MLRPGAVYLSILEALIYVRKMRFSLTSNPYFFVVASLALHVCNAVRRGAQVDSRRVVEGTEEPPNTNFRKGRKSRSKE